MAADDKASLLNTCSVSNMRTSLSLFSGQFGTLFQYMLSLYFAREQNRHAFHNRLQFGHLYIAMEFISVYLGPAQKKSVSKPPLGMGKVEGRFMQLRDMMRECWMSRRVDRIYAHLRSRHLPIPLDKVDTAPDHDGKYVVECVCTFIWILGDVQVAFVCMA
jgi:hypothetical protein